MSVLRAVIFTAAVLTAACGAQSQCEQICNAACQRAKTCVGGNGDCDSSCDSLCKDSPDDKSVNTSECVKQIQSLTCQQIEAVGQNDPTPLAGKCG